jgi:DNA-directed RNA polymerase specialized sigma24 family protein
MPLVDHRVIERIRSAGAAPAQTPAPTRTRAEDPDAELFRRARFLLPDDRLLLELAFKNHLSIRQIARLHNKPAGTISRKIMRLCKRLRDPAVVVLIDPAFVIPLRDEYRTLGVEHLLKGLSARQLADRHQMPVAEVRRIVSYIDGWCKGVISSAHLR